ncbi:hypothetical protein F4677DRAFT_463469 [Hypoxylon crocopeplum]|nr:hypothetical protein F4677DRAFT_463469 [Hypoxylon crocopeplum]
METPGAGTGHANDYRLVIGIDFGTTYSGIAWAQSERPDRNILINDWPSSRMNGAGVLSPKVQTKLRYLNDRGSEFEWGFQIQDDAQPQQILSLFKLGLGQGKLRSSAEAVGKSLNFRNVDQNITDYLSGLFQHFVNIIRRQMGTGILEYAPVQFILTVPAIWSDYAKQRTLEAFERIPSLPKGHSTTLLSEPEAAAIAALQEISRHNLTVNDSFVIVDAGGGTVDLITYTITALHPVLEVVEATEGTGDFCGSSRLNDRFAELLISRFRDVAGWNQDILNDALEHFESNTKRRFTMNALACDQSFAVPVRGLGYNAELGIHKAGRLSLRSDELHMLFEPDVLRIIQLVKEQIALANVKIQKILMVGGYGSSMYLRERLHIAIQEDASMGKNIEILQPPNSWTSVVSGAVMKGLSLANPTNYDVPIVKARTARKHYGYVLGVEFDDIEHQTIRPKRYYDGRRGVWRVEAMHWIIKRGKLVSEDTPFLKTLIDSRPVSSGRRREMVMQVYADQVSDEAPLAQNSNVQLLCRVTANLDHIPDDQLDKELGVDGHMYYAVEFQIEAVYRSASTEYTLIHKGRRYNTVTAEYV